MRGETMSRDPGRPVKGGKKTPLMALLGLALVLAATDLLIPGHAELALEEIPLLPALLGLAGGLGLVVLARTLRPIIRRKEGYYAD